MPNTPVDEEIPNEDDEFYDGLLIITRAPIHIPTWTSVDQSGIIRDTCSLTDIALFAPSALYTRDNNASHQCLKPVFHVRKGQYVIKASEGCVFWTVGEGYGATNDLLIEGPEGRFIHAVVQVRKPQDLLFHRLRKHQGAITVQNTLGPTILATFNHDTAIPVIITSTNTLYFLSQPVYFNIFPREYIIRFVTTEHNLQQVLPLKLNTPQTGYLTSPAYDGVRTLLIGMDAAREIVVPAGHVIMISFQRLDICEKHRNTPLRGFLELFRVYTNGTIIRHWQRHNQYGRFQFAEVLHAPKVAVRLFTAATPDPIGTGFKMLFSFHPEGRPPEKLGNGLFNCSVDHYPTFRQHLDCNLEPECHGGQDETQHCPFSSPACEGKVASGDRCFVYVSRTVLTEFRTTQLHAYDEMRRYCRQLGGSLVTIRSEAERVEFVNMFQVRRLQWHAVYTGIVYGDIRVPNMYRYMWVGDDNSVLYNTYHGKSRLPLSFTVERVCLGYFFHNTRFLFHECNFNGEDFRHDGVCQLYHSMSSTKTVTLPRLWNTRRTYQAVKPVLVRCPDSHVTQLFLLCDVSSKCGQTEYASDCAFPGNNVTLSDWKGRSIHPETVASVGMFLCDDGVTRIPFSLVCDFRSDCEDDSDELFCKHPVCDGFQCANGQCVEYLMRCDLLSDCVDGSDEDGCFDSSYTEVVGPTPKPPGIITLDGKGSFSFIAIKPNESCPTTHYRCPGEMDYCLPVYTRCNGFYDCLGREDEESCEEATCPGFYRCRASSVCVHPDHLCDGWPQCPQRDDELFCNMTCPEGCMCQGRASVCRQPLSVSSFLELRYVDAGGSRMTLSDADGVVYLIHLSLASCGLTRLTSLHLPNLRYMDLSHNSLQTINMTVFLSVLNLKTLTLAGNPLNNLYSAPSGLQHTTLSTIDLSKTSLELFESKPFSDFLALRHLNLSHTKIRTIGRDGFHFTQSVNNLDLTGSPVAYFEADLYQGLENIENIRSDNYKLCCERLLPSHFPKQSCFAPQDEISTCEDLLPSATYRGCLWLIGFMSVAGNAIGFAMRTCVQKTFLKSGFAMFVIHLSLSDFLMGVYMAIVGVADELFRGNYLFYDLTWTQSVGCKVAGFLSLLSNEVSALIILLITLDRFIVIRFPFSQFRFGKYSASAACLAAWTVGVVLAAIPLLPVTAHWEFYSQTGICIPLPVTRQDFQGRGYSLGVVVVLNFILFLLVAAGQAVIFWSVKQNTMTTSESSNKSRDMAVARRLITVALTDFFCWFPIGVCGLLALAGVPIPGEVNVAMAIFVLPINSALNPFLYTLNMIAEKRHRKSEEKLLRLLESVSEMASCPL